MASGGGSGKPEILCYITCSESRVQGGKQLTLLVSDEKEQKSLTVELAKSLNGDVLQLSCGDYVILSSR